MVEVELAIHVPPVYNFAVIMESPTVIHPASWKLRQATTIMESEAGIQHRGNSGRHPPSWKLREGGGCGIADGAAVLDCGNQLCIWLGAELPESTGAGAEPLSPPGLQQWDRESVRTACYDLAARLSASRFPVPPIRCVSQVGLPRSSFPAGCAHSLVDLFLGEFEIYFKMSPLKYGSFKIYCILYFIFACSRLNSPPVYPKMEIRLLHI